MLVVFIGWALLCLLLSDHPLIAVLGAAGRESSWLIYAGAACLFEIGRHVSTVGQSHLEMVVVGALVVNAVLAFAQVAVDADRGMFSLYIGRAHGLMSAHVYLGSVMAGGCGLVMATWKRWTPAGSVSLHVLFGATIGLSGTVLLSPGSVHTRSKTQLE